MQKNNGKEKSGEAVWSIFQIIMVATMFLSSAVISGSNEQITPTSIIKNEANYTNVSLDKAVSLTTACPGEMLTYNITFQNDGPTNANYIWINDTLPAWVSYINDSAAALPCYSGRIMVGQAFNYTFINVTPGLYSFSIDVVINTGLSDGITLTNWAFMNYTDDVGVLQSEKFASATTIITAPVITVEKVVSNSTANPGDIITYTVFINNTGSGTAYNVILTEYYPPAVTFISAIPAPSIGNNVWVLGTIVPGGSMAVQITVQIDVGASGVIENYVEVTYDNALGDPQAPVNDTATTLIAVPPPDIAIDKTAPATANPGETIMYTISYQNVGSGTANDVIITEFYPINVTFVNASPPPTSGNNVWFIGIVAPGASGVIYINVTIDLGATGTLNNTVSVDYTDDAALPWGPEYDFAYTTLISPEITLNVTVDNPYPNPGDVITKTITFNNIGDDWADNVVITEIYPPDLTFINAIPAPSMGNNVWVIGSLAPGGSGMIQINLQVNLGVTNGTVLTNVVTCDYGPGGKQSQDSVNIIVGPPASTSYVDPISPYWYNWSPITITATANTTNGTITQIGLYYEFSIDSMSWGNYKLFNNDTSSPWSWDFDFPEGQGWYTFYSIATNNYTSVELVPGIADAGCAYDNSPPISIVDSIQPYEQSTAPIAITATTIITNSPVTQVDLYFRFSQDNLSWGGWMFFETDNAIPWDWNFTFINSTGYYEFYSIALEEANNSEDAPASADAMCKYTEPILEPSIIVSKVVDKPTANPGDVLVYTIWFNNTGPGTATDAWNNDTLPAGTSFLSAIPPPNSIAGALLSWNFMNLGPGVYNITINVVINSGVVNGSVLSNSVLCAYEPGNAWTQDYANTTVIVPNLPPVADAGPDQSASVMKTVWFNGTGSHDPDGTIMSYLWDFGAGIIKTGVNVTHSFAANGTYIVSLTVTDDDGATDTDTCQIIVFELQPPVAIAKPDYQEAEANDSITVYANLSYDPDGTIVSYDWDFADGTTGTGMSVSHAYLTPGNYTITLTVTDNDGKTAVDTSIVNVLEPPNVPPVADAGEDQIIYCGETACLNASLSYDPDGSIASYVWDFGDGSSGSGMNTYHLYPSPGNYTVILTVTDDKGASDTDICLVSCIEDTTPPVISDVTVSPFEPTNRANITIICQIVDDAGSTSVTFTYLHNGTIWRTLLMENNGPYLYMVKLGPVNQSFTFCINASDTGGNMASYVGLVNIRKAVIDAITEGLDNKSNIVTGSAIHITGRIYVDGEANATGLDIIVQFNGVEIGRTTVQADGSYALDVILPELESGDNTLEILLEDNISGETTSFGSMIIPGSNPFPWAIFLVGSIITTSIAFGLATEAGKYALFLLFVPLYSKLNKDAVLTMYTRGKIHGYIMANPGDHYNSIKRALDLNNGSLAYHLSVLEKEGIIKSKVDGMYKRFYPKDMAIPNGGPRMLTEAQKLIIKNLEETPGISQKDIAALMGISASTVNYHINKLIELNAVRVERRGMRVKYYNTPFSIENPMAATPLAPTSSLQTENNVMHSGETMGCPGCDMLIEAGMKTCPFCGHQLIAEEYPELRKNKELLEKLEKAYKAGRISKSTYQRNLEKFNKHT